MSEMDNRQRALNRLIGLQDQERSEAKAWWREASPEERRGVWEAVREMCSSDDLGVKTMGAFAQLGVLDIELAIEAEKGI